KMGDYMSAIADYNEAIRLDDDFAEAYFNRGLTLIYQGKSREGIADLSKAGELGIYSAYNIIKRFKDK
ncbi:MAG: tetratricopeptide repeat protein, partial [Bacteroidaceae bacterium]|nr:tetratricopeptide repeat protein [Bacteroidaceae bacterium]